MPTQFEKRKTKSIEDVAKEIESKRDDIRAQALEAPVYDQVGFDVFTPDGGKTYKVAELAYNPVTNQAQVIGVYSITRLVALQYKNTKNALSMLKKK